MWDMAFRALGNILFVFVRNIPVWWGRFAIGSLERGCLFGKLVVISVASEALLRDCLRFDLFVIIL
jgi:hypothetical protein